MRNHPSVRILVAGAALAALTSGVFAAPVSSTSGTILLPTIGTVEQVLVSEPGAGSTLPSSVSGARNTFKDRFDSASVKEDDFRNARYELDGGFAKALGAPIDVFGQTDALTFTPHVETYYVDATPTAGSSGRFNTTTCTTAPGAASCERWFEAADDFTIDFRGEYSGFGFYGTDIGDFNGNLQLELIRKDGSKQLLTQIIFDLQSTLNGGVLFYGFFDADNLYTGVNFLISQTDIGGGTDFFGFDDLILGKAPAGPTPTPMPEPGSLALVGLSLLGLAATRRRRA